MKKRVYLSIISGLFLFSLLLNRICAPQKLTETEAIHASAGTILEKAVFFGDSTTYGLIRYNVENNGIHGINYHTLQRSQIWTPPDGTFYLGNLFSTVIQLSDGSTQSLSDACKNYHPQYLIITVGINGLRTWNEENFTRYYEKMLDMIREASPKTEIILQSVFPLAKDRAAGLSDFTPEKIEALNHWICSIAQKWDLCFLNTASALKDGEGYLKAEYQNGDGLHLNTQGFNTVLKFIEENYNAQ